MVPGLKFEFASARCRMAIMAEGIESKLDGPHSLSQATRDEESTQNSPVILLLLLLVAARELLYVSDASLLCRPEQEEIGRGCVELINDKSV